MQQPTEKDGKMKATWEKWQQAMIPIIKEYNNQQVAMIEWQGLCNSTMMEHDEATQDSWHGNKTQQSTDRNGSKNVWREEGESIN